MKLKVKTTILLGPPVVLTDGHVGEFWDDLRKYYASNNPVERMASSVVNAAVTHNMPCFAMSKKLLVYLVGSDKNTKVSTLNSGVYKAVMKMLYVSGIIENLHQGTNFKEPGKRKAGLIRIIDHEVRALIRDCNIREREIIEEYNRTTGYNVTLETVISEGDGK